MAGNDELIYRVKLEKDPQSFAEMKKSLKDLQDEAKNFSAGEGAEATNEFTEAMNEMNLSNAEGIELLIQLQTQIDGYKKTLKDVRDAKKEDTNISQEQRQEEVEARTALKATRKEYRDTEKAVIAASQAGEGQAKTYNKISAENRNIASEMKNIPWDDTTGRLDTLRKQWAENNKALKEFDAEMGDHRRNVGNYSEAMSTAASAVAAFQGPLGPIAGRINSINTTIQRSIPLLKAKIASWGALRVAMMATGIGAIVVVLGTMIGALRTMQPVMDAVTKRLAQLGAIWGNVKDAVGAFFGFNERTNVSMRDSIRIAGELADAEVRLDEARIKSITTIADLERSVANLRREAEDEANSHQDRIDMMEQAEDQTRKLMAVQIEQAEEAQRIAEQRAGLARNERSDDEEVQKARAAVINLRKQEDMQLRQLTRRRQSIINQKRVETERIRKNIQAIKDEIREIRKASRERMDILNRDSIEAIEESRMQRRIARHRRMNEEQKALELERDQEMIRLKQEFKDKEEDIEKERIQLMLKLEEDFVNEGKSNMEAMNLARIQSHEMMSDEIEALERNRLARRRLIQEEFESDWNRVSHQEFEDRQNIREQITAMEAEQEMRRNALLKNVRSDAHRQLAMLEVDFEVRKAELKEEFDKKKFQDEESRALAHQQAMLEFEEQFEQARNAIAQRNQQLRLDQMDRVTDIANNIMIGAFGDMKEVRIAQAIIDTYAGATRALAESPPGLRWLEFAAVITAGLANVAQIKRTEIGGGGGSIQGASQAGALSSQRGFDVIDERDEGAVARQVAEASTDRDSNNNPTFVFEGDLNPEVMAIKVRKGNRTINSKTLTTKSRG